MSAAIQVGVFDSQSVAEYTDQVIRLVNSHENTYVVDKALDTLARLVEATPSPTNTSITNCTFDITHKAPVKKRAPVKKKP